MSGHTEGLKVNEFCSLRKSTCPCGNQYKKPCAATAQQWEVQAAGSSKYAQKYKTGARRRGHEAHHIACVASVTGQITANEDIRPIVESTTWCINAANNMIALPMWSHTISWYVHLKTQKAHTDPMPPPFADLAQHDYDHDRYLCEVDSALEAVAEKATKAAAKHKDPTGNLAGLLNGVIDKCKPQLQKGGTHAGWLSGVAGTNPAWYVPFSMATAPSRRSFPLQAGDPDSLLEKIAEVAAAFLKLR